MENAKIISMDASRYAPDDILCLVNELNGGFPSKDISAKYVAPEIQFALVQLDMKKYAAFLDRLSIGDELKKEAYAVVDKIGSYSMNGGKRLFVGYNAERKVADRKSKEKQRGKYFYADGNGFSKINVDLPAEYTNRIVCADSLAALKELPDNCIDLIFTSPPYNFGLEYDAHADAMDWDQYFHSLFEIFRECIRVLKYGGRFAVNVQPLYSDYIPIHHMIGNFFIKEKLIWKSEILWEKNNYNCKMCSYGSWKSPSSPYMKYTWEYIEIYCKGDLKKAGSPENADITEEEFKSWVVAKWSIAPERHMKEYGHPAMFPEALAERVLKLFSFKGDAVLDPFNGAGTTTAVAQRLGRRYLGIDISEEYCATARKRIEDNRRTQVSLFD